MNTTIDDDAPQAPAAPVPDCDPVYRWTEDSRIVRGCRS